MHCQSCGRAVLASDRYCLKCGEEVVRGSEPGSRKTDVHGGRETRGSRGHSFECARAYTTPGKDLHGTFR